MEITTTKETNMRIDNLGTFIATKAMEAASSYIHLHNISYDIDALVSRIKANIHADLDQMLADTKQAFDAHMLKEAQAIFILGAVDCGVRAAKSFEVLA